MTARYVVIGNGAAGETCTDELRKLDPNASIVLIAAEPHPLYSRVALPGFLRGQIREEKVMLRGFAEYATRGIEVHFGTHATHVDVRSKLVHTDRGQIFAYDALLIAAGGRPKSPSWPGTAGNPDVLAFQTLDDAKVIIARADEASNVLVVGGSFIGYELAEGIVQRKKAQVTWLMRGPHFLRAVLDAEAGELCRRLGESAGVRFLLSDDLKSVTRPNGHYSGETVHGHMIDFDIMTYGVGLDYATEPFEDLGLTLRGGIVTDERLQTNIPDVYAAGDIAVFLDITLGRHQQVGTWDNAIGHGRTAARNMAGRFEPYSDITTYSTTMFGTSMAVVGTTGGVPGLESIRDFSYSERYYRKLFFQQDLLVGAILIGPPKGRKKLIDIMRSRKPHGRRREDLLEPANL
jgi:NAD(P)H-nitrite reductase large subunit